jgi:soluble lytic murein transglycosylase-like protein
MRVAVSVLAFSAFIGVYAAADNSITINTLHNPPPVGLKLRILPPPFTLEEVIRAVSQKHKVPAAMIRGVIAAESNFKPEALSPKGAIGLMQLMPATAEELGADPAVPEQNVEAGAQYLSWLLNRYRNKRDRLQCAIAAYNAGPGNVDRYDGVPPFPETRDYVKRVLANCKRFGGVQEMALAN